MWAIFAEFISAQCPFQNLVYTTQSSLDSFAILYPNCDDFNRNITLQGSGIVDLSPLSNLREFRGFDIIDCDSLLTLNGLENLQWIYSTITVEGGKISDFSPLNNLKMANRVNLRLENIDTLFGFNGLDSLDRLELRGTGSIYNTAFNNIEFIRDFDFGVSSCEYFGFESLLYVDDFNSGGDGARNFNSVHENFQVRRISFSVATKLESFDFLKNCKSIDFIQIVGPNTICDFSGLKALESAGFVAFSQMPMKDLSDFESLRSVDQLRFYDCDSLTSLHGLHDSLSINKNFEIALCSNLKDANGVPAAVGDRINELILRQNDSLEICNADWICRHIESGKETTLFDNAPGCNDPDSILAQCTFTTTIDELSQNNTLYPNPAYDIVCINHVNHASNRFSYEITDINGYKETYSLDNNCISVDHLAAGFYILHIIHGGHYIESLKFIKL